MIDYAYNGYDLLTNFFVALLYMISAYSFMKVFLKRKHLPKGKSIFVILLTYIFLVVALSTSEVALGFIISFCFICFMTRLLFSENTGYAIVVVALYIFIQTAIQILISTILKTAFDNNPGQFITTSSLLSSFIILTVSQINKKYSKLNINREYKAKYVICLSLMPILSIFIINNLFLFDPKIEGINSFYIIFTIILFFFLNLIIFKVFDFLIEDGETKKQTALFKQQMLLYSSYINENKEANTKARKNQHDLKNQLLHIKALLEQEHTNETLHVINKMIDENIGLAPRIICGNVMIDTILNTKIAVASRYNIDIETQIEVPENMNFDDSDICILLGNAIDNSIEACQMLEQKKSIIVFIKYIHRNLVIHISNPYRSALNKDTNGDYITTKNNSDCHGIGLSTIKSIINKYNGELKIDDKNNIFNMTIMLILN